MTNATGASGSRTHGAATVFATFVAIFVACAADDPFDPQPQRVVGSYEGISAALPTGSKNISPDGLVAAYDFETYTGGSQLHDFGPFGLHGAVSRTQETAGQFGTARVFQDLGDVVDLPEDSAIALDGPLTVAAWLRLSTPNVHQHILSCDDLFVLWTTSSNQYRLADTQANGFTTLAGAATTGGWHSVVGVLAATRGEALSSDDIQIYIDGVAVDGTREATWAPLSLRAGEACLIGAAVAGTPNHPQGPFEGALDEMLLFSRALTADEIRAFSGPQP